MINSFSGEYRFLSNFWPHPIIYEGTTYPSVEHAYQAAKSTDQTYRNKVAATISPGQAKKLGKTVTLRENWEAFRLMEMEFLVRQKFFAPELAEKLLATGEESLVENNWWGDTYWGVCKGVGENHLGKILMKIRGEIATQFGADNVKM